MSFLKIFQKNSNLAALKDVHVLNNKINPKAPKQKEMQNSCELGQSWEQDLVACLQHGACSVSRIRALPCSPLISSAGQSSRAGGF